MLGRVGQLNALAAYARTVEYRFHDTTIALIQLARLHALAIEYGEILC